MPNTNAIHSHIYRLISHAEFDVVTTNEKWHRQPIGLDGFKGHAAVTPGTISLVNFNARALILKEVIERTEVKISLNTTVYSYS